MAAAAVAQEALSWRDDSFDLALMVMRYDVALRTTPPPPDLLRLQLEMRDLARRVLAKIARASIENQRS
jgi:hypothetical protein